jgi:hypothetical protein
MLFDLRSRGRRRTVQVLYIGLALLMGGGLVLFGVGTGSGGGLLNGLGGGGGGGAQSPVNQEETAALKQIKKNPNDSQAWGQLLRARWTTAINPPDTGTTGFTAAGKTELDRVIQAWERYVQLTGSPDPANATLAARAYVALRNYTGSASAWEVETLGTPTEPKGYECLAVNAYAAGETRKGDLAAAKAVKLIPTKAQQNTTKITLTQAKTSTTIAKNIAGQC